MQNILRTDAPAWTLLIRVVVGTVFFLEGLQKFLYPGELGAGRFAKIGIPAASAMGPFVGVIEIVCGALVLVGFATRLASIPLIIDMCVALISTKLPILLGTSFWGFELRPMKHYGFLAMAHEARTDWSMLLCSVFLLLVGAGAWSVDANSQDRRSGKV
ncbi:MAG TPA: DoxX family protein [Polyangiaceae bacterium]|nr:DoxX family protein [Polyangiaceae bacterium]